MRKCDDGYDKFCSVSFGSGSSGGGSSSTSSSNTGLQPAQKTQLSQFIEPQVQNTYADYLRNQLTTPFALPPLNAAGVYDTQNNAVNRLLQDATGTASAGLAKRGFLNANATPLAGQMGVQSFLPQYLQQVGQNIQQQQTVPEQVNQQRFQDVANAFQQLIALLGGQSSATTTGSQSANSFTFGTSGS
jgi:hypothetical protein